MLQAVTPGSQVVQQDHMRDVEFFDEDVGLHDPGKIGGSDAAVDNRPCNAEARGNDALVPQMVGGLP